MALQAPLQDASEASALVDAEMVGAREALEIPAVSYGLIRAGELVHVGSAVGPDQAEVDESTMFRVSSLTKSVTAMTILFLRERGLLELATPVSEILPWTRPFAERDGEPVRLVHLLTMTAGLSTDDPWIDEMDDLTEDQFDAVLREGVRLVRRPGIDFDYSNVGYALLGRVITAVTGLDYRDVVSEEVLARVGMQRTGFGVPDADSRVAGHRVVGDVLVPDRDEMPLGAFAPSGGLWSCVSDLAVWVGTLESAAAGDVSPIPQHLALDLATPRIVSRLDARRLASEGLVISHAYGYGVHVPTYTDIGRVVAHQGGSPGFGADMRWHPLTRWGVVAMGNRGYAVVQSPSRRSLQAIVGPMLQDATAESAVRALLPATRSAMDWAEALLEAWDDADFERFASSALDRQMPRSLRASRAAAVRGERGPFRRDEASVTSTSPAHALWRMEGREGEVWLEVLITPAGRPLVQHLGILDFSSDARIA